MPDLDLTSQGHSRPKPMAPFERGVYDFLFNFNGNHGPICKRFQVTSLRNMHDLDFDLWEFDLREREHFSLISFEKCGERGYFIHGEVQDEVVNVLFAPKFRRRQSTASAGSGRRCRLEPAASWLTVTVEVGRDMRVEPTYLIQKIS